MGIWPQARIFPQKPSKTADFATKLGNFCRFYPLFHEFFDPLFILDLAVCPLFLAVCPFLFWNFRLQIHQNPNKSGRRPDFSGKSGHDFICRSPQFLVFFYPQTSLLRSYILTRPMKAPPRLKPVRIPLTQLLNIHLKHLLQRISKRVRRYRKIPRHIPKLLRKMFTV